MATIEQKLTYDSMLILACCFEYKGQSVQKKQNGR